MKYIFISLIIIIIIFYILLKSDNEFFNNFNIRNNMPVLWLHNNKFDIETNGFNIRFKKSKSTYYSNEYIQNNSFKTGYIFKPVNCKDIKFGLGDKNNKNKINFCFNLIGNNIFKIEELERSNEQDRENTNTNIIVNDLDYCFNPNIVGCNNNKKLFRYTDDDLLCITINENKINFIVIKNYDKNPVGLLIHISKNLIDSNKKLYAIIYNEKQDNTINNNFWITKKYSSDIKNIKWSLNYLSESKHNLKKLPQKEDLKKKSKPKSVYKEPEIKYPKNARVIIIDKIILNTNNKLNINGNNILKIQLLYHNIYLNYLKNLYSIDTIIYFKNEKLVIPFNKKFKYFHKYVDLYVDVSKYINIILNKDIEIQVVLRSFKISDNKFNVVSKPFKFKLNN